MQGTTLTRLPSEILRKIFRSLFEEVNIDLKRPHELNQQKLIESFPVLAVDERLLLEGTDVLLRHATLEIENLTNFPVDGPALLMLRKVRNLALQNSQLATFDISRQFPPNASRSSRNSFENLQKIDVNICSSLSDLEMILLRGCDQVAWLVRCAWQPSTDFEKFDLCYVNEGNHLVEFIRKFQRKYAIVLRMEFWLGGRLVSHFLRHISTWNKI
jgi:hypothetical protein